MEKFTLLELHLDEAAFSMTNNAPGAGSDADGDAAEPGGADEREDADEAAAGSGASGGPPPGGGPPRLAAPRVALAPVRQASAAAPGGGPPSFGRSGPGHPARRRRPGRLGARRGGGGGDGVRTGRHGGPIADRAGALTDPPRATTTRATPPR